MRPIDADQLKKAILEERDKIPLEIVGRYTFGVALPDAHGAACVEESEKRLGAWRKHPPLTLSL